MARHHYLSASSYQNYASDLLKDKIEQALGPAESKEDSAAVIDWELDGVRTHPAANLTIGDGKAFADGLDQVVREAMLGEQALEGSIPDASVDFFNEPTGGVRAAESDAVQMALYKEAKRLAVLSPEMRAIKNMYENALLRAYTEPEFDQNKVEDLVQAYTQARIQDAMLKVDFAKQARSASGHIF